ncbi:MAG: trypsin-like serine protease, partial [Hyphomonadaceae bacterium]|nr:trypsin-like serine protease [Hyphomonadaceae bacterium]
SGTCDARTDRSDCLGRERPGTITDHCFGRDDRVRVNAQQTPWRFMGRFANAQGELCTATLIARDVIVTAAHCIHGDRNEITGGGTFRAEAGGEAQAVAYVIDRRFDFQRFNTTDEIDGLDWALIRLDQPLGDRLGFAGVRVITDRGTQAAASYDLLQAGYSWDTGDTLSGNINCHIVRAYTDGTFAHECDTTRGDSGSAFLIRNAQGGFEVIGVDSNFRSNPNGPFIYIAVSASSFQPFVADFVAGRTGTRFGSAPAGSGRKSLNKAR